MRGNLGIAGQPGVVYTPEEGRNLPAVVFGHGWLAGAGNYRRLLEHLASWGFVAAAPDTEHGPLPSHLNLATDLLTTLEICAGVRLGGGDISVHPDKLALAGHGMGAGAAVIAASQRAVGAVAALYPAPTAPSAESLAPEIEYSGPRPGRWSRSVHQQLRRRRTGEAVGRSHLAAHRRQGHSERHRRGPPGAGRTRRRQIRAPDPANHSSPAGRLPQLSTARRQEVPGVRRSGGADPAHPGGGPGSNGRIRARTTVTTPGRPGRALPAQIRRGGITWRTGVSTLSASRGDGAGNRIRWRTEPSAATHLPSLPLSTWTHSERPSG